MADKPARLEVEPGLRPGLCDALIPTFLSFWTVIVRIPQSRETKQSSHFDKFKAPCMSWGWIATARYVGLAMTKS